MNMRSIILLLSFLFIVIGKSLNAQNILKSTFLGGSGFDNIRSTALGNDGSIFITGKGSTNFPVTDTTYGKTGAAFLCKMDTTLKVLHKSYRFGGIHRDAMDIFKLAIFNNEVFMLAQMPNKNASDIPTTHLLEPNSSPEDAIFIAKFSIDLELIASTYFGDGIARSMTFDEEGNVYVGGGFSKEKVIKLTNDLTEKIGSIGFGDIGLVGVKEIFYDTIGSKLYVAGTTTSDEFPVTENALQKSRNKGEFNLMDGFITSFDSELNQIISSTYFGGYSREDIHDIVRKNDKIFVLGQTGSEEDVINSPGFDQSYNGGASDYFLASFDLDLEEQLNSTYIGGEFEEGTWQSLFYAPSLVFEQEDTVILVSGVTTSNKFYDDYWMSSTGSYSSIFFLKFTEELDTINYFSSIRFSGFDGIEQVHELGNNKYLLTGSALSQDFITFEEVYDNEIGSSESELYLATYETTTSQYIVGTEEKMMDKNHRLHLYPMPCQDQVTLTTDWELSYVTISSVTGEILYEDRIGKKQLDLSNLEAGMYLLTVENKENHFVSTTRIVKK